MKIIYIKYILLLLLVYIYLYNPIFQILDFGIIKILLFISIGYIFLSKKVNLFITLFRKEIIFTLILIIYSSLAVSLGDGSAFNLPYKHIIWFMEGFIIPFFFILIFKDIFQKKSWESIVVLVGLIAALITMFLILNPGINLFIRNSVIRDSLTTISDTNIDYRGFTLSENSTYGYGIIQGLILSICLISLQKNFLYAIPVIFVFLSILFNARIGFVSIIIAFALMIIYGKLKIKNIFLFVVIFYVGFLFILQSNFAQKNLDSLKWGFSFFEDTFMLINGQYRVDSNYSVLTNNMIHFPKGIFSIIFGEGRTTYGKTNGSDIGYVNQIFIGGIFYLLIMLYFLLYMFRKNILSSSNKLFTFLFFLTLIVVNIKGDAFFVPNGFFRLITFYYVYCILIKANYIRYLSPIDKI